MTPLVIYDNECYLCVQFAKFVNFLAKGRLRILLVIIPILANKSERVFLILMH